jgi:hypothetical protein
MMKTVVKEEAIRELIKEAFDNVDAFLDVPEEQEKVVNTDPSVQSDFVATDLNPVEPQFEPCDKVQFMQGIDKMLDNVPSDVIPSLYAKVRDVVSSEMNAYEVSREHENTREEGEGEVSVNKTMNIGELRSMIKAIISEATRFNIAGHRYSDEDVEQEPLPAEPEEELPGYEYSPIEDYDDEDEEEASIASINFFGEDDEDEEDEKPTAKKAPKRTKGAGYGWSEEGDPLEKVAKEIGYSVSGTKRMERETLKKVHAIMTSAVPQYIAYLNSSGELTPEDVKLLRRNPAIVADLPGFKDYLKDLLKRDTGDEDEEEKV